MNLAIIFFAILFVCIIFLIMFIHYHSKLNISKDIIKGNNSNAKIIENFIILPNKPGGCVNKKGSVFYVEESNGKEVIGVSIILI